MTEARGISPRLVLLLALACGATVANLYYAQPLLHTCSSAGGSSPSPCSSPAR